MLAPNTSTEGNTRFGNVEIEVAGPCVRVTGPRVTCFGLVDPSAPETWHELATAAASASGLQVDRDVGSVMQAIASALGMPVVKLRPLPPLDPDD